jgi:hypothetical protein
MFGDGECDEALVDTESESIRAELPGILSALISKWKMAS